MFLPLDIDGDDDDVDDDDGDEIFPVLDSSLETPLFFLFLLKLLLLSLLNNFRCIGLA